MDNSLRIIFILIVVFIPLERFLSLRAGQRILRKGWVTDLLHYFSNTFLLQAGMAFLIMAVYLPLRQLIPLAWQVSIYSLPIVVQIIMMSLIAEIGYYSAHRLFHRIPFLWRFHRVHHSSAELDWLSTARFHPVDLIVTWSITLLPIMLLGFAVKAFAIYQTLWLFQNYLAHSNVKWPFPFLSKILVTPQNHHWHHSDDPQRYNNNFAGQLMIMDHLFATYYNPQNQHPDSLGVPDHEGDHFFQNIVRPLCKKTDSGSGHYRIPFLWRRKKLWVGRRTID